MQRARSISALVLMATAMGAAGANANDYSWSNGTFDIQAIPNPLPTGIRRAS